MSKTYGCELHSPIVLTKKILRLTTLVGLISHGNSPNSIFEKKIVHSTLSVQVRYVSQVLFFVNKSSRFGDIIEHLLRARMALNGLHCSRHTLATTVTTGFSTSQILQLRFIFFSEYVFQAV